MEAAAQSFIARAGIRLHQQTNDKAQQSAATITCLDSCFFLSPPNAQHSYNATLAILLRCETPTFYGPTRGFLATFPNQFMVQKSPHIELGVRGDFLPENLSTSGTFCVLGHRMPLSSLIDFALEL